MINTSEILSLTGLKTQGADPLKIKGFSGCSIDSRKTGKGGLFIAIKGENKDGHEYISQVFKKGVRAALVNKKWLKKNKKSFAGKTLFAVDDTIKSLGELAVIHRKRFNIPVFCIGGSNGKTSTKDLMAHLLSEKYNLLYTEGNLNNHLGMPLTLLRMNSKHEFCLLEAGSNHFNEIKYLCEIAEPDYAVVTNIGREHLEFFKSLDGVAKEEFTLFDYVINTGGVCFANFDDEYIRKYFKNKECFSFAYSQSADVKGIFKGYTKSFNPEIKVSYKGKSFNAVIPTFGKHSVYNGLSSIAAALYLGMTPAEIKSRLETYIPKVSQRMQIISNNDVLIINDAYNSNPDSVKIGLETIAEYKTKGAKHIVISDMLEMGSKSTPEHKETGRLVKKLGFKNLYTYGQASYHIFKGAGNIENNFYFEDKSELAEFLKRVVNKGDLIYFKASRGMKLEDVISKFNNKNI